ncbi:MobV family relaxase [Alistipes communis]|uniref:MobV family relaxase n=1 Tax=Alistipes communis TaxID=2585118 RepID=UPI00378706BC
MNTDIKQAMHVEARKSFGTAEANENERRWDDNKIERKNQDPTNHYDKSRMELNFEIGPDGKIHPLGYQQKSLEVRLMDRLAELGWHPFKADSMIQPNCCARFIFGGNHDRTLEMAFGDQAVNLDKEADNSHLRRCPEIEQWAKDVYDWCARRYGQENIIGFQVHLDESSPHIHALIVPVGQRAKSGRECVMWSAKFGKNSYEYGRILREMHTSLYEEVGSKYGLERGDSIEGRHVSHLNKRDYIRQLTHEARQAEKAVKGLQSMIRRLETQILNYKSQLDEVEEKLASGRITLDKYDARKADLLKLIAEYQTKLEDKAGKLQAKEQELDRMTRDMERVGRIAQPFRNHRIDFDPPRITTKPPMFGVDKWLDEQNRSIASRFVKIVRQIEALYRKDAEQQVQAVQRNALVDYQELKRLQQENARLTDLNWNQTALMQEFLDQLAEPSVRERIFTIADALIGGQHAAVSSGGGGGISDSDLRWDGRRPDEEEEAYRRRCLMFAINVVKRQSGRKSYRRR